MKTLFIFVFFLLCSQFVWADIGGINILAENDGRMEITVNGKVYTTQPKKYVSIKTRSGGLFRLEIKVFDPINKLWYILHEDVRVTSGYDFHYEIKFEKGKRPSLNWTGKYPSYSRYYLNPSLYNRHQTT